MDYLHQILVVLDVFADHAILCGYCEEFCWVEAAQSLDVYRAACLRYAMVAHGINRLHLRQLPKLVRLPYFINALPFAPFNHLLKTLLHLIFLELSGPAESQQIMVIPNFQRRDLLCNDPLFYLPQTLLLFWAHVVGESCMNYFLFFLPKH